MRSRRVQIWTTRCWKYSTEQMILYDSNQSVHIVPLTPPSAIMMQSNEAAWEKDVDAAVLAHWFQQYSFALLTTNILPPIIDHFYFTCLISLAIHISVTSIIACTYFFLWRIDVSCFISLSYICSNSKCTCVHILSLEN